jgi:hypothetical protein
MFDNLLVAIHGVLLQEFLLRLMHVVIVLMLLVDRRTFNIQLQDIVRRDISVIFRTINLRA